MLVMLYRAGFLKDILQSYSIVTKAHLKHDVLSSLLFPTYQTPKILPYALTLYKGCIFTEYQLGELFVFGGQWRTCVKPVGVLLFESIERGGVDRDRLQGGVCPLWKAAQSPRGSG